MSVLKATLDSLVADIVKGKGVLLAPVNGSLADTLSFLGTEEIVPIHVEHTLEGGFRVTKAIFDLSKIVPVGKPSDDQIRKFRDLKIKHDSVKTELDSIKEEIVEFAGEESGTIKFMLGDNSGGISITTAITPLYDEAALMAHMKIADPKNKTEWMKTSVDVKKIDGSLLESFKKKEPKKAYTVKTI